MYTANVTFTANSNVVTNATFTMSGVSNTQTVALIDVGFTGTNTAAQSSIEVYPSNGAIRRISISSMGEYFYAPNVTPNSGGTGAVIRVNSVGTFSQTANGQDMIIWK
jgi:SAM-dependent MidA family methyltransferase